MRSVFGFPGGADGRLPRDPEDLSSVVDRCSAADYVLRKCPSAPSTQRRADSFPFSIPARNLYGVRGFQRISQMTISDAERLFRAWAAMAGHRLPVRS